MKIYTKTGDAGDTGLFGGGRVPKNHPRVEAYGDVDELNALLLRVQQDLFAIGALLATPDRAKMRMHLEKAKIDQERIAELERAIDAADTQLEPLRAFILPGGSPKAAALHVARTVCRRAERRIVEIASEMEIPTLVVVYLNRLSDVLFTLARLANKRSSTDETTW
jgi:cob(I)alamin adenosyltransferase